jgi:hypothetical protein
VGLAHLSEENNNPKIAYQAMQTALGNGCGKTEKEVLISVAEQNRPGTLFELS